MSSTAALVVCAVALPSVRAAAIRWRLFDDFGPLKIHRRPISRLGGFGILLGVLAGLAFSSMDLASELVWPFLALFLVWFTGLWDDLRGLSPLVRLLVQFAAGLLLWFGGWGLVFPGGPWLGALLTCLFVSAFVNALNWLDGTDGLAAGVVAVVMVGFIGVGQEAGSVAGILSASVLGSVLGFLLFNFPPARIFMGESGSNTLGFLLAFLSLDYYRSTGAPDLQLLVPLAFAALPLGDAAVAILRRLRARRSPFHGDRQHFYDVLLQRGWTPRRVALSCYGVTATLVLAGWLIHYRADFFYLFLFAVLTGCLVMVTTCLGVLRKRD